MRSESVAERDEHARGDKAGHTLAEPAPQDAHHLDTRSNDQARAMAKSIGEPAGRQLEDHERQVACRENRRHDGRRHLLFVYPPEQVEAVHQAFEAGDLVRQVQCDISLVAGSVRRHVS